MDFNLSTMKFLRSRKAAAILWVGSILEVSAAKAAFCEIEEAPLVTWPCIFSQALIISWGPVAYPIRHPVMAKDLDTPLITMHLSKISGNAASDAWAPV